MTAYVVTFGTGVAVKSNVFRSSAYFVKIDFPKELPNWGRFVLDSFQNLLASRTAWAAEIVLMVILADWVYYT